MEKNYVRDILEDIENLAQLRCSNSEDLYKMLDEVDLNLKNIIINIKELIHDSRNQD